MKVQIRFLKGDAYVSFSKAFSIAEGWHVWKPGDHSKADCFPTHADAIAYADSLSRSRPADEQSPHPPHTRPLTAPGNA